MGADPELMEVAGASTGVGCMTWTLGFCNAVTTGATIVDDTVDVDGTACDVAGVDVDSNFDSDLDSDVVMGCDVDAVSAAEAGDTAGFSGCVDGAAGAVSDDVDPKVDAVDSVVDAPDTPDASGAIPSFGAPGAFEADMISGV
jgi:hypothetical protein